MNEALRRFIASQETTSNDQRIEHSKTLKKEIKILNKKLSLVSLKNTKHNTEIQTLQKLHQELVLKKHSIQIHQNKFPSIDPAPFKIHKNLKRTKDKSVLFLDNLLSIPKLEITEDIPGNQIFTLRKKRASFMEFGKIFQASDRPFNNNKKIVANFATLENNRLANLKIREIKNSHIKIKLLELNKKKCSIIEKSENNLKHKKSVFPIKDFKKVISNQNLNDFYLAPISDKNNFKFPPLNCKYKSIFSNDLKTSYENNLLDSYSEPLLVNTKSSNLKFNRQNKSCRNGNLKASENQVISLNNTTGEAVIDQENNGQIDQVQSPETNHSPISKSLSVKKIKEKQKVDKLSKLSHLSNLTQATIQWKEDMKKFSSILHLYVEDPTHQHLKQDIINDEVGNYSGLVNTSFFKTLAKKTQNSYRMTGQFCQLNENETDQEDENPKSLKESNFQAKESIRVKYQIPNCPFIDMSHVNVIKYSVPANEQNSRRYNSYWMMRIDELIKGSQTLSDLTEVGLYKRDKRVIGKMLEQSFPEHTDFGVFVRVLNNIVNNLQGEHILLM